MRNFWVPITTYAFMLTTRLYSKRYYACFLCEETKAESCQTKKVELEPRFSLCKAQIYSIRLQVLSYRTFLSNGTDVQHLKPVKV